MLFSNNVPARFFTISFLLLFLQVSYLHAQLPVCSGPGSGMIYYINGGTIYNLDPSQPISATNPSINTLPVIPGGGGIAVSPNINGPGPSPTFYVVAGANYHYYDGTQWVNTGHTAGAVNPGGGGGFIYSLNGSTGDIYKYDGTGNATLLTTITDFSGGGPFDGVADCHGNFYLLRTSTSPTPQYLRKYDPNGNLLQAWTVSGATSSVSGGGMAVIGNKVYFYNGSGYWEGIISGSNVNFTLIAASLSPGPSDFSSCPLEAPGGTGPANASADTLYFCDENSRQQLYSLDSIGSAAFTWTVAGGDATIYPGNADTIEVSTKSDARIVFTIVDTAACGSTKTDTVYLRYLLPDVDAGLPDTIIGCRYYVDTLAGSLKNTANGLTYSVKWAPLNAILDKSNTLSPVINPTERTTYTLTVTIESMSGCSWTDDVTIDVQNQVKAELVLADSLLCTDDTTIFDASRSMVYYAPEKATYMWTFGDGDSSKLATPAHAYAKTGLYPIRVIVTDTTGCSDTADYELEIYPPPYINLGDDTTICEGLTIMLPLSNTAKDVVKYIWHRDSTTDNTIAIKNEGDYVVTVFSQCGEYSDTFRLSLKDCAVWFPSGFTPNGDGLNEIARLRSKYLSDIADYTLLIVNRFGEKVFVTNDVTEGWDGDYKGTRAEVGTYYYMIKYRIAGGEKEYLLKGDLTLIR